MGKEFRIMGLTWDDSVYSSVFFFLTGLHFFHLVVGLFLLSLFFWSSTFPSHVYTFINLRISEVHLFYNLLNFYWHFLEILWLFIFLFLYSHSSAAGAQQRLELFTRGRKEEGDEGDKLM